jgi:hypothetical protein
MQTVSPEILECLLAPEVVKLACLCKATYNRITKDLYSMNFVNKWKHVKIKDWAHFNRLMPLMQAIEMDWPVDVLSETKFWFTYKVDIDWSVILMQVLIVQDDFP